MKKSVLIVRFSSLGDVVLTTGVIRELATQFPEIEIDVVTSKKFSEVYTNSPYIRNCFEVDTSQSALKMALSRSKVFHSKYDYIFDLQNSLRSMLFTFGLSSKIARVAKFRMEKLAMVRKKERLQLPSIPDRYRSTVQQFFSVKNDNSGLELFVTTFPQQLIPHRIGIAPGAKHFTKRLPLEKWKDVIDGLLQKGFEITVLGGIEDKEVCRELAEFDNERINNCGGATSLRQTVEAIQECQVVISNDSSVAHIASACKVPIVSIFGSTTPGFGFLPYQTQNIVIENVSLKCRPCTHIGRSSCPLGHFECMNSIQPTSIVDAVVQLTKNT
jgi:lipopolysaccharide heptosyltransferase II